MEPVSRLIFASIDLAHAEMARLRSGLRATVADLLWVSVAVVFMAIGVLLALAGLAVAIVAMLGWSASLLLVGVALGALGWTLARSRGGYEPPTSSERSLEAPHRQDTHEGATK